MASMLLLSSNRAMAFLAMPLAHSTSRMASPQRRNGSFCQCAHFILHSVMMQSSPMFHSLLSFLHSDEVSPRPAPRTMKRDCATAIVWLTKSSKCPAAHSGALRPRRQQGREKLWHSQPCNEHHSTISAYHWHCPSHLDNFAFFNLSCLVRHVSRILKRVDVNYIELGTFTYTYFIPARVELSLNKLKSSKLHDPLSNLLPRIQDHSQVRAAK